MRNLGSVSDSVELRTLRYDWRREEAIFVDLSGFAARENVEEVGGLLEESYDRFLISVQSDYPLGLRSRLRARITHTEK